ncbi:subtilisin-like protease SBT3.10 isoform X1 [Brassica rapa]|uniref:subtilisin-like protease SBT3.10 isoform X1 n=1 Tax=Brassica campestris TaxID=3711 RepID=UPI00142E7D42|nr:subtilisin-like protease SBT3.10 isoform X1 [Brassica rapa]
MGQTIILVAIILTVVMNAQSTFVVGDAAERKVYVVYLGEKEHDDPASVTEYHHQMLWSLLGSKESVHDSIVYSYRHGFSGFAAKLTESQAQQLSELPEVVHVIPNTLYELTTTRTWDYLGLSPGTSKSLVHKADMGRKIIVGVIDTGVWPESEMYNDKGYGPIPSRWKGSCESGELFNGSIHCNKKLIGAKYFVDGLVAEIGDFDRAENAEYASPRDFNGHGTHVSSTIGGSFLPGVSYLGLGRGTVKGGAPGVRLAIYKACWLQSGSCSGADVLKAIDEAIHDGVDVLSLSLGSKVPLYSETDVRELTSVGAFHAVAKGIPVVAAAGNDGPSAQTISNVAPWILTVAATTLDRSFPTAITLGNNITILGQAIFAGPELGYSDLTYPQSGDCQKLSANPNNTMEGKVVLCFTRETSVTPAVDAIIAVRNAGGLGVIIARNPTHLLLPSRNFPSVAVDFELGTDILFYIRSTRYHSSHSPNTFMNYHNIFGFFSLARSPIVKIGASRTLVARPVATKVATFSSRGPSSISPAILKPDIAAPGVNILAATSLNDSFSVNGFSMKSGTSMATPVVSGIVVLLKSLHPHWSPSAIKSAIVTTAWKTDPSGEPIFADGSSRKLADPFDYGGGLVNPERAAKPGLVYDMATHDYVLYLCAADYSDMSISRVLGKATVCPTPKPSVLDLNLPSITIPNLRDEVTLTRTVTNVGPLNSVYKVVINPPTGVNVGVTPTTFVFNSTATKLSFTVRVTTTHRVNTGYFFGSLTWSDNMHNVAIPLSVRTQILPRYYDEN